jgi:hypothetical protein
VQLSHATVTVFNSYNSGSTDSTSSPINLITTSSPDPASTSDEETNPTITSTTHNLVDHDTTTSLTTTSLNPVTHDDQESISATIATTISSSSSSQEALNFLPYAVGGAVGGIIVIIAIILTVVIVSLLVRKSRGEKSHNLDKVERNKDIGLLAYNNAIYSVGKEINTCGPQNWQLHCAIICDQVPYYAFWGFICTCCFLYRCMEYNINLYLFLQVYTTSKASWTWA